VICQRVMGTPIAVSSKQKTGRLVPTANGNPEVRLMLILLSF